MNRAIKLAPAVAILSLLAACGTTLQERVATGAAGGAIVGQAVGGNTKATVTGAAVGAAAGALRPR